MLFLMYSENQNHITDLTDNAEIFSHKVVNQRYDMPWEMLQTKDISLVDQSVSQSVNSTMVWKFQHLFIRNMKREEQAFSFIAVNWIIANSYFEIKM
jgi:hypothetical protein